MKIKLVGLTSSNSASIAWALIENEPIKKKFMSHSFKRIVDLARENLMDLLGS